MKTVPWRQIAIVQYIPTHMGTRWHCNPLLEQLADNADSACHAGAHGVEQNSTQNACSLYIYIYIRPVTPRAHAGSPP